MNDEHLLNNTRLISKSFKQSLFGFEKSSISYSTRVSQSTVTSVMLNFGRRAPLKRLIIFLGNSLSFGSSRFQDQVVKSSQVSASD